VPIGEPARRTGVATPALRYYERIGLMSPAERVGRRKHHPAAAAERVALIRLYQDAGFTLAEIGRLLAATGRRRAWAHVAERKIAELDARIADAQAAKDLIERTRSTSRTVGALSPRAPARRPQRGRAQRMCASTLRTVPPGSSTKNRRTPHGSSVSG
jgi:MerR family redox-sensitive transcriptional activator SoxR